MDSPFPNFLSAYGPRSSFEIVIWMNGLLPTLFKFSWLFLLNFLNIKFLTKPIIFFLFNNSECVSPRYYTVNSVWFSLVPECHFTCILKFLNLEGTSTTWLQSDFLISSSFILYCIHTKRFFFFFFPFWFWYVCSFWLALQKKKNLSWQWVINYSSQCIKFFLGWVTWLKHLWYFYYINFCFFVISCYILWVN